jgi:hypothetical protein
MRKNGRRSARRYRPARSVPPQERLLARGFGQRHLEIPRVAKQLFAIEATAFEMAALPSPPRCWSGGAFARVA